MSSLEQVFNQSFEKSIELKQLVLNDGELKDIILSSAQAFIDAYKNGNCSRFCGNGGSAGDAQHIAAELSGRFYFDRPPLDAEALHVNGSYVTAVANDYSYDVIYERMVQAQGKPGDVLVGISTSGNSKNVLLAMKKAKELGMKTIALTGEGGGAMAEYADFLIAIPSKDTPRIQEVHILVGHIICQIVEEELFGSK
ncbi:MAG: D-sedoheptulose 7-phosphate isomerase [Flavobacteriales bacterium]|nr:D-sedoheptulose 7-phosphate isomerase [Flavobacteriales bacterium]